MLVTGHSNFLKLRLLELAQLELRQKQICLNWEQDVGGEGIFEGGQDWGVVFEVDAVLVVEPQQVVEGIILAAPFLVEHTLVINNSFNFAQAD